MTKDHPLQTNLAMDMMLKKIFHSYIYLKKCETCKITDAERGLIQYPISSEDKRNHAKLSQLGLEFLDYVITMNCPRGAVKPICLKCDTKLFSGLQVFSGVHTMSLDFGDEHK